MRSRRERIGKGKKEGAVLGRLLIFTPLIIYRSTTSTQLLQLVSRYKMKMNFYIRGLAMTLANVSTFVDEHCHRTRGTLL